MASEQPHLPGHGRVATKLGHGLAKPLGIKLNYRDVVNQDPVTRGESVYSVGSADAYIEQEPTSMEWIYENAPTGRGILDYFISMFPFLKWIHRYNTQWLIGDLVAGITIGAVVVPQGMAYALLANLEPQFGLYSSFMGVLIYWFFATSKDITIGPVAVMSTIVGNILTDIQKHNKLPGVPLHEVASALAVVAGGIICALGLLRLGWIVNYISLASITAFITGSAFYIAVGQVPTMLGIPTTKVNNRDSAYKVAIGVLTHLNACTLDAALGLTSLLFLYLLKYAFTFLAKKFPRRAKLFFFLSTLRTVFIILLYTLISWLGNRDVKNLHATTGKTPGYKKAHWAILGPVPRGFQDAGVPQVNHKVVSQFVSYLPVSVIVLLIEHISIAKSFGRVNNYTIDPSQEFIAIGVTNLIGPFLGAYPATGSFSRTAIKSKAGVRTPLAGVITAIVVLLAIYALPAVFFYIPKAVLASVIIHAVLDLIAPANTIYQFWRISPLEVFIFLAGVFVTVFTTIEIGIYVTLAVSLVLVLFRLALAQGRFLGKVTVHSVIGDHLAEDQRDLKTGATVRSRGANETNAREVFVPINHQDGTNPLVDIKGPYPGVFIFRFSEGLGYPNAGNYLDYLVRTVMRETRRTDPSTFARPGDRPWNDPGPRKGQTGVDWSKPTLKAIILDFSSVNNVDITGVQYLVDVRNQLDRFAAPDVVEWHIASITNRWTKRALASAGFGYPTPRSTDGDFHRWKPIFSVAEIGGSDSAAAAAEARDNALRKQQTHDVEAKAVHSDSSSERLDVTDHNAEIMRSRAYSTAPSHPNTQVMALHGLNRPFFHIDLSSALDSAIRSIESRQTTYHEEASHIDENRKGYGTEPVVQ